jgi:4-hydroxybenzoate polyprenyltransferase
MARRPLSELAASEASQPGGLPRRSAAASLVISLRPEQWTKNLLVFAGVIFSQELFQMRAVELSIGAFAVFCGLSSVVYLVNDIMDREADRQHPLKKSRPIAAGDLSPRVALVAAAVIGAGALAAAFALRTSFGVVSIVYIALQVLYSGPLKRIVILDVLAIAAGFVLRAVAGAVVINVAISQWLLVCTTQLALFLALSKRRHELVLLADGATGHRKILGEYSPYLLDQMIGVVTASTLIAYTFYCINPETAQKFHTELLGLTIPFPLYGIFRYLYLVHRREGGGSPSQMLVNDRPLLACVALWVVAIVVLVYFRPFGV